MPDSDARSGWEPCVTAGQLPVERGFVLDDDDRLRRAVIGQLTCREPVSLPSVPSAAPHDAPRFSSTI